MKGLPWSSSGWDFTFQMQDVRVPSLLGELGSHISRGQKAKTEQRQYCNKFNKNFENGPHPKKKKSLKEKRNEVLTHATTWTNLGNVMLREKSCHQRLYILWFRLCRMSGIGQCRWPVARSWGKGGIEEGPLMGFCWGWWSCLTMIVARVVRLWIYTKPLNCTLLTRGTISYVSYMSIRLFFKNKINFGQPQGFTAQSEKGHHQRGLCGCDTANVLCRLWLYPHQSTVGIWENVPGRDGVAAAASQTCTKPKSRRPLSPRGLYSGSTAALTHLKGDQTHGRALESVWVAPEYETGLSVLSYWISPSSPGASMQVQSLGQEDPLEKEMATHSSILAWTIPWTEEPD